MNWLLYIGGWIIGVRFWGIFLPTDKKDVTWAIIWSWLLVWIWFCWKFVAGK